MTGDSFLSGTRGSHLKEFGFYELGGDSAMPDIFALNKSLSTGLSDLTAGI